jgi:hypothetical protein
MVGSLRNNPTRADEVHQKNYCQYIRSAKNSGKTTRKSVMHLSIGKALSYCTIYQATYDKSDSRKKSGAQMVCFATSNLLLKSFPYGLPPFLVPYRILRMEKLSLMMSKSIRPSILYFSPNPTNFMRR